MNRLPALCLRYRTTLRVLFFLYAATVFTTTHIPAFKVQVPGVDRPDLAIHLICFGGWYIAFWLAAFIGPPLTLRSVALSIPVAIAYAAFDESTQALPFIRRTCAWDDFLANGAGILLAALVAAALALAARPRTR